MVWTTLALVFPAGPLPLMQLRGRRVRVRAALRADRFPADAPEGPTVALEAGCEGFIGHPAGRRIVLAFPRPHDRKVARLNALLADRFDAIAVSEATLRLHFEIDA